jgi:hypothetical protein
MPYEEAELPQEERNATEKPAVQDEPEPQGNKIAPGKEENRAAILSEIGAIMKSLDPDQCPWFTDAEKAQERAIAQGAAGIKTLANQRDRLRKELEKRKAAFKPIPFDDDKFEDDVPWNEIPAVGGKDESEDLDIF